MADLPRPAMPARPPEEEAAAEPAPFTVCGCENEND